MIGRPTRSAPVPPFGFGRTARVIVSLLLIALGADAVRALAGGAMAGIPVTVPSGLVMPIAGVALLIGRRPALRVSEWALRIQLVVTAAVLVLTISAGWPGTEPVHVVPGWRPLVAGACGVLAATAALVWIARLRKVLASGPRQDGSVSRRGP